MTDDRLPEIQWPKTNTTKLVLIQGTHYSAYKGRRHIVTVEPVDPMNDYWLEQFRVDPARMLPEAPKRSA